MQVLTFLAISFGVFLSSISITKAENTCAENIQFARISAGPEKTLKSTIICNYESSEIRLYGTINKVDGDDLTSPTIELLNKILAGNQGLLLVKSPEAKGLFNIYYLEDDKIQKTGYRKEKYFLYSEGDEHLIIRCEQHADGYKCVSYPRIKQKYKTYIGDATLHMRIGHPLSDLDKFPSYYRFVKEFISRTDFKQYIKCDSDKYYCTGKKPSK